MTAQMNSTYLINEDWISAIDIIAGAGKAIGLALSDDDVMNTLPSNTVTGVFQDMAGKFDQIALMAKQWRDEGTELLGRIIDIAESGKAVGVTISTEEVVQTLYRNDVGAIAYDLTQKFIEIGALIDQEMEALKQKAS